MRVFVHVVTRSVAVGSSAPVLLFPSGDAQRKMSKAERVAEELWLWFVVCGLLPRQVGSERGGCIMGC